MTSGGWGCEQLATSWSSRTSEDPWPCLQSPRVHSSLYQQATGHRGGVTDPLGARGRSTVVTPFSFHLSAFQKILQRRAVLVEPQLITTYNFQPPSPSPSPAGDALHGSHPPPRVRGPSESCLPPKGRTRMSSEQLSRRGSHLPCRQAQESQNQRFGQVPQGFRRNPSNSELSESQSPCVLTT